jgi:hypothetical protein
MDVEYSVEFGDEYDEEEDDEDNGDSVAMIDFEAIELTQLRFFSYHAQYRSNMTVSFSPPLIPCCCTLSPWLARTRERNSQCLYPARVSSRGDRGRPCLGGKHKHQPDDGQHQQRRFPMCQLGTGSLQLPQGKAVLAYRLQQCRLVCTAGKSLCIVR